MASGVLLDSSVVVALAILNTFSVHKNANNQFLDPPLKFSVLQGDAKKCHHFNHMLFLDILT